ncbi:MAG TPA: putative Ig domain-containing protein [Bryobacteraceae bacterium]|nr:putative Ig domain-containing protein [Bryobacteraceae bacterium]
MTLNAATGAISGTPAANTAGSYVVTVTATDSANVPVKGSATFTLIVAGGLFMTSSGSAPYHATFGTASAAQTAALATGGTYPYTYAITSPASLPAGLTVNPTSGVVGTSALTPAGTYHVTVTATDSTSGTPLTGSITFDIVVALQVSRTNPVAVTAGSAGTITTVSATGNTGTVTYALDAATAALGWVTLNSSTGVVAVTTGSVSGTKSITVTATDGTTPANATAAGTGSVTFTMTIN